MIYLDNSSTTREYDEVIEFISETSKNNFGNPSSLHSVGYNASNLMEEARAKLESKFFDDGRIIFTSGGTESDNMALVSGCRKLKRRGNKIITTDIEHPAVLETCRGLIEDGFEVKYLHTDVDGYIEPQELKAELNDNTILVSIMTVNNEVGTIEPVMPAFNIVNEYNWEHKTEILFHTDAVQAFGKLSFEDAPFDMISVSSHKIHGPKGVGALYLRKGLVIPPFITGGGQECGYRSTTENVPAIGGFGMATEMSYEKREEKMHNLINLNDYLRKGLMDSITDCILNGPKDMGTEIFDYGKRCPSILNITFMGTRGEVLLHTLEQDGIFVSTGSACASNKTGDSHVLKAMSLNHKEIEGAIRFSLDEFNTISEMDFVIDKTIEAVSRFRRLGSFR